jgi:hypothetical protein
MLASFLSIGQILAIALPCTSILAVATLVGVWYYKRRTGEQVEALMAAAILRLRAERAEQVTEIAALRAEVENVRAADLGGGGLWALIWRRRYLQEARGCTIELVSSV